MGTGSGIGAIVASQWAARVVAIDINPAAVRCAKINALLNQVEERVEVLQGDLFAPVRDVRFDVMLFNPPYLRREPRSELERALWATDVIERFAVDLRYHLTPNGYALIVLSSDADTAAILNVFEACGFSIQAGPTAI
jgi:release factor glutamine methyltransferase